MDKVLMVIPIYNEEKNLKSVIEDLEKYCQDYKILFIDDGSTDQSLKVIQESHFPYLINEKNLGYCYTLLRGVCYGKEHDYDYVIFFDSDGQHLAKEVRKLMEQMKKGKSDMVIGSRYLGKGYPESKLKKISKRISSKVIERKFGQVITDTTSGFRCINRKMIERMNQIEKIPQYFDLSFLMQLLKEGYKLEEVPTEMRARGYGKGMYQGVKALHYLHYQVKESAKQIFFP